MSMYFAAIRGDLRMLMWLYPHRIRRKNLAEGPKCHVGRYAISAAIALGQTECVDWLCSIGAETDRDADAIKMLRKDLLNPCKDPWDY